MKIRLYLASLLAVWMTLIAPQIAGAQTYNLIASATASGATAVGSPGSGFTDVNGNVWQGTSSNMFQATNPTSSLTSGFMIRTSSGDNFGNGKITVGPIYQTISTLVIPVVHYSSASGGSCEGVYIGGGAPQFFHVLSGSLTSGIGGAVTDVAYTDPGNPYTIDEYCNGTTYTVDIKNSSGTITGQWHITDSAAPSTGSWGLLGYAGSSWISNISGYSLAAPTVDQVVFIGDSTIAGTGSDGTHFLPVVAATAYPNYATGRTMTQYNAGVAGTKVGDWQKGGGGNYDTHVTPAIASGATIAYIDLGANDANAGTTQSAYSASMASLIASLKGDGITTVFVGHVFTPNSSNEATQGGETGGTTAAQAVANANLYNTAIDALITGSTKIGSTASVRTLSWEYATVNFGSGGLHPNQVGYNKIGPDIASCIAAGLGHGTAISAGTASGAVTGTTSVSLSATAMTGSGSGTNQWYGFSYTTQGNINGTNGISGATGLTANVTGLSPATTYYFSLVQTDSSGSEVVTNEVVLTTNSLGTVATPTFSPTTGATIANGGTVTVTIAGGATGYYTETTDGSTPADPTTSSTAYSGPLTLTVAGTTKIKVIATEAGYTNSAIAAATYTVSAPSETISSVTVAPSSVTLGGSTTQSFTATVTGTNGGTGTGVTWTATAGSFTGSGLTTTYTAPAATGSVQTITVTATSTVDNTKSGTATVTINAVSSGLQATDTIDNNTDWAQSEIFEEAEISPQVVSAINGSHIQTVTYKALDTATTILTLTLTYDSLNYHVVHRSYVIGTAPATITGTITADTVIDNTVAGHPLTYRKLKKLLKAVHANDAIPASGIYTYYDVDDASALMTSLTNATGRTVTVNWTNL